jgi:hypothetical protein
MKFPQDFTKVDGGKYTHPDGWSVIAQPHGDWEIQFNGIDMSADTVIFGHAGVQAWFDYFFTTN